MPHRTVTPDRPEPAARMTAPVVTGLVLAVAALLSGCATPRQKCITAANQQVRSTKDALATAEGNVARGYAIHHDRVPYTIHQTCYRTHAETKATIPYPCPTTRYRTEETPVAIDIAEERRKVARYQDRLPRLRQAAVARVRQCRLRYPDDPAG